MTKDEFWGLFKRFVMYHPANQSAPCHRLDTWAVLKNLDTDLNDPALGMTIRDRDKPHYFSRQWAGAMYNPNAIRHRYPILVANIQEVAVKRDKNKVKAERLIFDLAVLDTMKAPKGPTSVCDKRTEIEVFQDCHDRLQELFAHLELTVVATVTPLAGPDENFVGSEQELVHSLAENLILAYVIDETETNRARRRLKGFTEEMEVYPWRGGLSDLYGVYAPELAMEFPICETEITLEFPSDYAAVINERESY